MSEMKRIMCFGDSLTWGWVPTLAGAPTSRYPRHERWGGAMAIELGDGYEVLEEGLSARTTNYDDPIDPRLNGSKHLPAALASHFPLDLVVVMLGTNDTKSLINRTPYEIATGLSQLLAQILTSAGGVGTIYPAPKAMIVAPPPLAEIPHPWFQGMFAGGRDKGIELKHHYMALASFFGVEFLDAAEHITTDGVDGVHFTAATNIKLGKAVANRVASILNPETARTSPL
jgi:lysophospholipase L1-like esterase